MHQAAKVRYVCGIVLGGLLAAVLFHGIHRVLGAGYPLNSFLFRPEARFSDFYDIFRQVQAGDPLGSRLAVYFPFAYVPLHPLAALSPQAALRGVLLAFSAALFLFFRNALASSPPPARRAAALVLAFGTYPFLFCVDRANLEMIVLLFMLAFFALLGRGRYLLAGVMLACATAMKLYPGVFGVLLLARRRYAASAVTGVLTLLLTFASAAAFPGGLAGSVEALRANLRYFQEAYVLSPDAVQFGASWFSLLKLLFLALGEDVGAQARAALTPYTLFCLTTFALLAAFALFRERILWKQAYLMAFAAIALPEVSFDYKLIHLLPPLGLFLAAPPGAASDDRLYAVLFGLLLIPKAYPLMNAEIAAGVLLNPLLMLLLAGRIIWTGLRAAPAAAG